MKKYLVAILFAAFTFGSQSARAGDEWDTTDKVLFAVSTGLLVVDWGQTRGISHQDPDAGIYPDNVLRSGIETNPLLGRRPSHDLIDLYFITAILGNYFLTDYLDPKSRRNWQFFIAGLQAHTVSSNFALGLKVSF